MPANLPPDYHQAEQRLREAKNAAEKLEALEEMLAIIPKHKGTDHLQADLKRRMAKLRRESDKKGGPARHAVKIEREGAGQIILLGTPNTGKSQLLAALTAAHPVVADFPYSTRSPVPGMMSYEDVQVQLVDTPPVAPGYMETYMPSLVRSADGVCIVVDLSNTDFAGQVEPILSELVTRKVSLVETVGKVSLSAGVVEKGALIVANKSDAAGAENNAKLLRDAYSGKLPILVVSAMTGEGLPELRRAVFGLLDRIRIYTKAPGRSADLERPFVVPSGTTVFDLARAVHKDIAGSLKYARLWGRGTYNGQMIERTHILLDRDVIELHS